VQANSPRFSSSPTWVFASLIKYRHLIWQLTKREVVGKYRGSVFGFLWSFFNPLLMLVVYTFFFGTVLKVRWADSVGNLDFAALVFVGMIVHGFFSEVTIRSSSVVAINTSYVKRVVFPLETLPWPIIGAALFHSLASFLVLVAFIAATTGKIPLTAALLPLVFLPLILFTLGCAWIIASLSVYIRDTAQVVAVLSSVMMFIAPVFYPATALPPRYRPLVEMNPLTPAIEGARMVILHGIVPPIAEWLIFTAVSLLVAWIGLAWFQRSRAGFADVL
jgi:lipopolysaccharide transport system permease protein